MANETIKGPIQSVSRAAAILRCFYDHQELALQEICELVGLHKSTTSTLVITLKNEQLLEQDPVTSKYRLGMSAFILGASTQINLRTLTLPYLSSLNTRFLETVNLAAPVDTDIIYINKIESDYSMRTCTRIGQRLPFYCTANGKAIFAYYPEEKLQRIINSLAIHSFSEATVADSEALCRELAAVRTNGYACDNEELEQGLCCYAAPIFDCSGAPAAAISVSGPVGRLRGDVREEIIPELKRCAADISRTLAQANYMAASNLSSF